MLDNLLHNLQNILISDYLLLLFLIIYGVIGFFRGAAKIIIHTIWFVIGLFVAALSYRAIRNLEIFDTLFRDEQVILFINFLLVLLIFYLIKNGIYKVLSLIAAIHGPCPLNRFLAFVVGYSVVTILSWYIALDVYGTTIMRDLIDHEATRFGFSFTIAICSLLVIGYVLFIMLNVRVGIDKPCPLIKALQPLDDILNAKNVDSFANSSGGIILGMIQALVMVVMIIIIINHTELIYFDFILNAKGLLLDAKNIALHIQQVLSKYLLFID